MDTTTVVPRYHVIPHTHWDREWYLSFEHFRVLLVHLIDDLLQILDEDEDYTSFLLDGQTIVIDDYLDIKPEKRERISDYVQQGRMSMGPWYVLPDSFLVSGESLVRNLMRGRATARAFGGSMDIGYIPDSFGHTAQIPQILRGLGMDKALAWRGFGGEPGQESSEYQWIAPDGSSVLMEHLSDVGYSGAYFDSTDPVEAEARFEDFCGRVDFRAQTPERLMLSGGDHHWPTSSLPEVLKHLNLVYEGKRELVHSSLPVFMKMLEEGAKHKTLPVVRGELRFGYRWAFNVTGGVYSSRMYIKQVNARTQRLLERYLEPLNVLAVLAGGPSQTPMIQQGWRYLLQNHPHDSICGCSIDPVHREMMTRYEKLEQLGIGVERFAWQALEPGNEGDPGDDRQLYLFNPSPFPRDEVVTCTVDFFKQQVVVGLNPDVVPEPALQPVTGFEILDADGEVLSFEILNREETYGIAYTRFGYPQQSIVERFTVRIPVKALPPLGRRTLTIHRTPSFATGGDVAALKVTATTIENAFLRVEAQADGAFMVTDKTAGKGYGPLGHFQDGADCGDEYNYSPPSQDQILDSRDQASVKIEPIPGRYQVGLRVSGTWSLAESLTPDLQERDEKKASLSFETNVYLTEQSRHVRFETLIDNTIRDHRLRVVFETGCATNEHHADNAFAILSRTQKEYDPSDFAIEVPAAVAPMHRFVTVEDDTKGATVIADGLPEYELQYDSNGRLLLTLLRCVGELGRDGLMMRPGGLGGWRNETPDAQCAGRHHYRYAFFPHETGWSGQVGRIQQVAESFLLPVRQLGGKREEPTPADQPFLAIEPETLTLSALKEAEDGEGVILRVYNPTPTSVEGSIRFSKVPGEIRRANLEERPGDLLALEGSVLHDTWAPYRIQTYRLEYGVI